MRRITFITLVAFLIAGCSKFSGVLLSEEMHFVPERSLSTRATDAGFEIGDVVGVYVTRYEGDVAPALQLGGNHASNASLTYDGRNWSCLPKVYWEDGRFDVYAYYPRTEVTSVDEYPFSIALDQRVPASAGKKSAYEQSDFLWARNQGVVRSAAIPLVFRHRMSKLDLRIVKGEGYEGDIPSNATVYVHNTVTASLVDLATGDVVKDPYGTVNTVTALQTGTGRYTALLIPQMLTNRLPLFEIVCGDVSYLLESKFHFKSGVCHTVNIVLSDNPERVRIDIGGEVTGWD